MAAEDNTLEHDPLEELCAGVGLAATQLGVLLERGRERRVLVVKAAERRGAVHAVGEAVQRVAAVREYAGVNFSVDVDPQ